MRMLVISDTQFDNYKDFATDKDGFNSRFLLQVDALRFALEYGMKKKCLRFIHLGDVFDRPTYAPTEVVNLVRDTLQECGMNGMLLTGNHDSARKSIHHNVAYLLANRDTSIVHSPIVEDRVAYLPYYRDEELFLSVLDDSYMLGARIVFCHQEISGMPYRASENCKIRVSHFSKFKKVYTGHVHTPCAFKNIVNVGALYHTSFSDSGTGDRYAYIVDSEKEYAVIDKVQIPHPKFITAKKKTDIKNTGDFYRIATSNKSDITENKRHNVQMVFSIQKRSVERVFVTSARAAFTEYCRIHKASQREKQHGLSLMKETIANV